MSLFEIRRRSERQSVSVIIDFATVRGKAIMRSTSDSTKGALASGQLLGFLSRDVVTGGPSVIDRAQLYPNRLELQDTVGGQCTLELADAVECEGSDYVLTSGTGALSSGTALGTGLSFNNGLFRVAQTGDQSLYKLGALPTAEVSGNLRIYAERN